MNNQQKKQNGCFHAQDNNGRTILIEWHISDILSAHLADFKKTVCDLASQVTAQSETEFLKRFPEAIASGGFLKSCESLFAQGLEHVDWNAVEQKLETSIKQFYMMDLTLFGQEIINKLVHDRYFFAAIKDKATSKLLGFLMSAITPALPEGDIKLINLAVVLNEQDNGLEQLLLGCLIRVLPEVKRIFTMVRPTNKYALDNLALCGFVEDKNPTQDPHHPIDIKYFTILECKTDQLHLLQTE